MNRAAVPTENTLDGFRVWCTISKERSQREEGSHASELRRILYSTKVGVQDADTDYCQGSVWHKDVLFGSVQPWFNLWGVEGFSIWASSFRPKPTHRQNSRPLNVLVEMSFEDPTCPKSKLANFYS